MNVLKDGQNEDKAKQLLDIYTTFVAGSNEIKSKLKLKRQELKKLTKSERQGDKGDELRQDIKELKFAYFAECRFIRKIEDKSKGTSFDVTKATASTPA